MSNSHSTNHTRAKEVIHGEIHMTKEKVFCNNKLIKKMIEYFEENLSMCVSKYYGL